MKISCIILTGDIVDEKVYKKCLASVSWCSEIIKVDTKNIKGSFSEWRNEGLKKAKGDWILYIDTDEVITENLKLEIGKLIENWKLEIDNFGYAIPRRNYIFNKEFKHSGQYPDYQIRLFKKDKLQFWEGELHEHPKFSGELGYLKNPILHYKNITISQMLDKTNRWSEIESELLFKSNHPNMNIFRFASVAFREFWLRFVKQLSFLDGTEGVIYGIYQIYSRLITYSKLWEKQL